MPLSTGFQLDITVNIMSRLSMPAPGSRRTVSFCALALLIGATFSVLTPGCHRSSGSDPRVTINEVVSNISTASPGFKGVIQGPGGVPMVDAEGQAVDWVEIHNPTRSPINLAHYTLSDDLDRPKRFRFPRGRVLGPGEFIIVICDGQPDLGPLHAEFKLRGEGETVYLFADDGNRIIDRKGYVDSQADSSVGRYPDSTEQEYGVIFVPTPGAPNKPVGVRPPKFSGASELTPAGPAPEDLMDVTVTILEDREILSATLTVRTLGDCGDPQAQPGEPFTVSDFVLTDLGLVQEGRRNFRGKVVDVDVHKFALTYQIQRFPDGTLLELDLLATNVIGETRKIETQVVGGTRTTLAINEYQPRNVGTRVYQSVINADGADIGPRTPDWLEIINYGDEPIDLTGFTLMGLGAFSELQSGNARPICTTSQRTGVCGNSSECLYIWRFDDVPQDPVIQPGEKRIILCDADCPPFFKEYRLRPGDARIDYSANFQLSGDDADIVVMRDPCGVVVDIAEFDFTTEPAGEIAPDLSFGRFQDGAGADPSVLIECPLSTLDPPPGDDSRIYLTPGCRFNCPSPGASNVLACDVAPTFDRVVEVQPRCPADGQPATVRTFLSIDEDTVNAEELAGLQKGLEGSTPDGRYLVEMHYEATLPGGEVQNGTLTRDDGLILEPVLDVHCLRPEPVNGAVTFELRAVLPGFPAGTLVTFSYRAQDLFMAELADAGLVDPSLAEPVEHREEDFPTASFRYLSGFVKPPLFFNEVLPQNVTLFAEFYDESVRNLPDFRLPDFAEIYNHGPEALDLGGLYLSDSLDRDGCPRGLLREVRKFRIPDGVTVGSKDYILLLFVDELSQMIDLPPALAAKTVFVDTLRLDNTAETLFLIAGDDQGHCIIDRSCWTQQTPDPDNNPDLCIRPEVDRSFGWLPDRDPGFLVPPRLRILETPTPGEPNCPYEPVEFVGEITHKIAGALEPLGCVSSSSNVIVEGFALVNAHQWLLRPDTHGLELAEIVLDRGGSTETLPLTVIRNLQAPAGLDDPTICQALLKFSVFIPPPQPDVVRYTIRLMDVEGTLVEAGPFSYGSAGSRPEITINEAQLVNTDTIVDPAGSFSPWIELHNGTGGEFDLGGMFLTDDLADPRKWKVPSIPEAVLPSGAGAFLVVFLNGETANDDDLQSSLTFAPGGVGTLYLLDRLEEGHCVLQTFDYDFTGLDDDATLGLLPDGEGLPDLLDCATPGRSNLLCDDTQKTFVRGDANVDLRVNISDMAWIFRVIFGAAGITPTCEDAFDADDDGEITVQDGLYIGDYLFLNGPAMPGPFPTPGLDLTPDSLNCF